MEIGILIGKEVIIFQKLIVLPTGSEIHAFATYDITVDNPVNPYSPPR
ncbi:MAG: hypothetical protein IPO78_16470 [Saprospiraceae bacterium]|nr:hypothetical protein [Saprospiraceae bacterium]